jgi:hypothetical protein
LKSEARRVRNARTADHRTIMNSPELLRRPYKRTCEAYGSNARMRQRRAQGLSSSDLMHDDVAPRGLRHPTASRSSGSCPAGEKFVIKLNKARCCVGRKI